MNETVKDIIYAGLIGILTLSLAYHNGFFIRPAYSRPQINLSHLMSIFLLYLSSLLAFPLFLQIVFPQRSTLFLNALQNGFIFLILVMTFIYAKFEKSQAILSSIKNQESHLPWWKDFGLGVLVWTVAYPWVIVVNQTCDLILEKITQYQSYEQVAVRFLRDNLESTEQLALALSLILVIAPIIEELLFRGMLQQYLKKHFSLGASIALSSIIFAFFHYSTEHDLGNFSLIPSLFVFSCFLGYIYERQGSLFASIGLHVAFNIAGVLQVLYFS